MKNDEFEGKIEAGGEFELHPPFWKRLKEALSSPEISERLVKALGRKKAVDWYDIREYRLDDARDDELVTGFPRDGDCILVLENENPQLDETFIKFDSPNSDAFDLEEYRKLRHRFKTLYLTNVAASDKILTLLIGKGRWDVERHYPEEKVYTLNADTVDSLHASASIEAGKLLALDSEGKFPNTVLDGMQSELDANKPASPTVGDMFIARDTSKVYVCFTAGAWTDITGLKSLFDANTILKADADNTPIPLTIAEQRLVGRITAGNIAALTAAQVLTLLGLSANLADLTDAEAAQLENIGPTTISAAQWGYLGGSSGIDHYVDRGDPAAHDFALGALTTNGAWQNLDLSGIVPAGAVAVHLWVQFVDDAVSSLLQFRKNGNANEVNQAVARTQVSNVYNDLNCIVALDAGRVIEYKATNVVWTQIWIDVRGWWIL